MLNDLLIERIVQGETNAFGEFHAEMYDRMFYYVFKVLKDKEAAEDIVQETFFSQFCKNFEKERLSATSRTIEAFAELAVFFICCLVE